MRLQWRETVLLLALGLAGCRTAPEPPRLARVSSWAMQLQGLEVDGAADRLAAAAVDMLVIEPTRTVTGQESFPTRELVSRIRADKLCLAYLNVGQAEDYRTYWRPDWKAPTAEGPGFPSYLLTVDPEGWPGNYPVAYWDIRWKAVLWGSKRSLLDLAIADGFDGVYLDWVLGFSRPEVERLHADPAGAMRALIGELRAYARKRRPGFLVIAQNGAELPGLDSVVDGYAQECLSFTGAPAAEWDDSRAGELAIPDREARAAQAKLVRVPRFSVDYVLTKGVAVQARAFALRHGFVPFLSRVALDRLPEPWLNRAD